MTSRPMIPTSAAVVARIAANRAALERVVTDTVNDPALDPVGVAQALEALRRWEMHRHGNVEALDAAYLHPKTGAPVVWPSFASLVLDAMAKAVLDAQREDPDLTQQDIGEHCGVSRNAINQLLLRRDPERQQARAARRAAREPRNTATTAGPRSPAAR